MIRQRVQQIMVFRLRDIHDNLRCDSSRLRIEETMIVAIRLTLAMLMSAVLGLGLPTAIPAIAQAPPDLTLAAEEGDANAQYRLARLYEQGTGVPQDDFAAVRWLTAAARQDHPDAALDLGWMLANGYGAAKDVEQAYYWFVRATALGAEGAAAQRDALAREIPPEDRDRLADDALRDLPEGIQIVSSSQDAPSLRVASDPVLGPGDTLSALRQQLNEGGGIDVLAKLRLMAGDGNIQAANILGTTLRRSTDNADRAAGLDWLITAARGGLPAAQYNLAAALLADVDPTAGGRPDYAAILTWLDAAERANRPPAADDYAALSEAFAARASVSDPYLAAMQGVGGLHRELAELIAAKRQEVRARQELDLRLTGQGGRQDIGDIETTVIE